MKNFTQKFIGILALVFAMSFNINAQEACISYTPIAQEYMSANNYESVIQEFETIDELNGFVSTLMLESCKENGLVDAKLSLVLTPSMCVIESVVVSSDLIPARLGGCSTTNFGPVDFEFSTLLRTGVTYGLMLEATNGNGGISWQRSSTPTDPSNPYEGGDMYIIDGMCQEMGMPMDYCLMSNSNLDMQFSVCGELYIPAEPDATNSQIICNSYTPIAQEYMSANNYESVIQGFEGFDASNGFVSTLMLESCKENGLVDAKLSLVLTPSMCVLESVVVSSDLIPARLGGCSTTNFGPVDFVFSYPLLQEAESYGLMLETTNGNGGISWQRSSTPTDPSNPYEGGDMYVIDGMCQEMGMPMDYCLMSNSNLDMQFSVCTKVYGCTDTLYSNYNPEANIEDGTCVPWEDLALDLQNQLDNTVAEDGIGQEDVDAAYADGAASVDITSDNQGVADGSYDLGYGDGFEEGAASVTPEDGIGPGDVDAAFADGVASVEVPECEEVAAQNMPLDLPQGWSMFGYTCIDSVDVMVGFSEIADIIEIVKDEWGLAYLPSWNFNAIAGLHFSEGYQIKMIEEVADFQFCTTIAGGASQEELDAAYAEGAASITPEDGVTQADLDALAENYAGWIAPVYGCTGPDHCNYNPLANTDDGSCVYAQDGYDCDGNSLLQIGDQHAGGIVFQINEDGTGLVASVEDLVFEHELYGPTQMMDWSQAMEAAENITSQGYDDWYLPSLEELELVYNTIGANDQNGFQSYFYWSSSQFYGNGTWAVYFSNGYTYFYDESYENKARVIRAF